MDERKDIRSFFSFVRAAAILGIFFYHIYDFCYGGFGTVTKKFGAGLLPSFFSHAEGARDYLWGVLQLNFSLGGSAASLFFIASGFGLYLSHLNRKTPWPEFYTKRAVRVLPLYWAACLAIYLMFPVTLKHLLLHVFLVQIFTPYYVVFGGMWFISYLFLLYLLFPMFVLAFRNPYAKWGLFAASFFLTPLWEGLMRAAGFTPAGISPTAYWQVFMFGMLIAESVHRGGRLHRALLNPGAAALSFALIGAVLYLVSYHVPATALAHRVIGILMFLSLYLAYPLVRRLRAVRSFSDWLSYAAYAVYLTHMPLFIKLITMADTRPWLRDVLVYPRIYFGGSPFKFIQTSFVLLLATLAISYAIQKAYDRLVGRLSAPRARREAA